MLQSKIQRKRVQRNISAHGGRVLWGPVTRTAVGRHRWWRAERCRYLVCPTPEASAHLRIALTLYSAAEDLHMWPRIRSKFSDSNQQTEITDIYRERIVICYRFVILGEVAVLTAGQLLSAIVSPACPAR